jgi:hypothetical protein
MGKRRVHQSLEPQTRIPEADEVMRRYGDATRVGFIPAIFLRHYLASLPDGSRGIPMDRPDGLWVGFQHLRKDAGARMSLREN